MDFLNFLNFSVQKFFEFCHNKKKRGLNFFDKSNLEKNFQKIFFIKMKNIKINFFRSIRCYLEKVENLKKGVEMDYLSGLLCSFSSTKISFITVLNFLILLLVLNLLTNPTISLYFHLLLLRIDVLSYLK